MRNLTTAIPSRIMGAIRRAFGQFLALPLVVILGFVLLAILLYGADAAWSEGRRPDGLAWLGRLMGDAGALGSLLATVASSIITVTSITFSLLLVALQQGSSSLTAQVVDQFLMRRANQFYFGYFVGLSIFVLMNLVTVSGVHLPVYGAVTALILTAIALCMIVVMIYNTIDQMRPAQIVRAIREHVIRARIRERDWLARTRRTPRADGVPLLTVTAQETGHIERIDLDALVAALDAAQPGGGLELALLVRPGGFAAFGDPLGVVRGRPGDAPAGAGLDRLPAAIRQAFGFDDGRDLTCDPGYGLSQLATIGWTSVSTAKSNPSPGLAVIESLRDILARWLQDGPAEEDPRASIVCPDMTPQEAVDALETMGVVASESIQPQTFAAAIRTVALLLPNADPDLARALAGVVRRWLATLGEHVPTRELDAALTDLARALAEAGFTGPAGEVAHARTAFAACIGVLNSRSTRVPDAKEAA